MVYHSVHQEKQIGQATRHNCRTRDCHRIVKKSNHLFLFPLFFSRFTPKAIAKSTKNQAFTTSKGITTLQRVQLGFRPKCVLRYCRIRIAAEIRLHGGRWWGYSRSKTYEKTRLPVCRIRLFHSFAGMSLCPSQ